MTVNKICLFCGEKITDVNPVMLFSESKKTGKIETGYMHKKCHFELKNKKNKQE